MSWGVCDVSRGVCYMSRGVCDMLRDVSNMSQGVCVLMYQKDFLLYDLCFARKSWGKKGCPTVNIPQNLKLSLSPAYWPMWGWVMYWSLTDSRQVGTILEWDQGSKAPSTFAFHQLNNELSMYIQYLICIPRVLNLHSYIILTSHSVEINNFGREFKKRQYPLCPAERLMVLWKKWKELISSLSGEDI